MKRHYKGISINTSKNTHEKVFDLIEKDKNSRIVDIPCGSGAFVMRLKDHGYHNVTAIDIENILEIDHDDFMTGDMTKGLPLENHSVDVLVCIDGIEHISQQFSFVKEVNRILKAGGEFIISIPNISALRSRWRWFMTGHHHKCKSPLDENNPNPLHHIGMISYPEIRYLLHTSGFRIVKVITNRTKPISWLYVIFIPFSFLWTSFVYHKSGKKEGTSKINREVRRKMYSKAILLGESLIVKAIKTSAGQALQSYKIENQ
ncbi:MAG: class I SAM-dependent methyltransferase [Bacteroidales bacterium]|nr:class I SAM-dependent methyltransferase [Bacteroidales bacterium]